MRRLLAALALPAAAFAQDSWVQSSATLALKLSYTGEQTSAPGRIASTIYSAPLETLRLGNREILEDMLADDALPGDTITGWRIVAIWANWPDADPYAGNSYRFYARRGRGASLEMVPVPSRYLAFKPLQAAFAYRNSVSGDSVVSGSEKFTVYVQTDFAIGGHQGVLTGINTSTGRYVRPTGSEVTYYLPGASKVLLQGTCEIPDAESGYGVASGTLSFGESARVITSNADSGSGSSGSSGSTGATSIGSGSLTKLGAGTLILGGTTTYSGSISIVGGTLHIGDAVVTNTSSGSANAGGFDVGGISSGALSGGSALTLSGGAYSFGSSFSGTLTLNTGTALVFSSLHASAESLTGTLAVTKAGTLTLGTGETLALLAGDTLALNTLTLAQLSRLTWAPAP